MRFLSTVVAATTLLFNAYANAQAPVSLNSLRIAAADPAKIAAFYNKAFGMHEVNRLTIGDNELELFLNFGANVEAAKTNSAAQLVIQQRANDNSNDPITHVVFTVTDVKATAAALTAAGGTMDRAPFEFGNSGIFIGMGKDPAGNGIELLQFPKP